MSSLNQPVNSGYQSPPPHPGSTESNGLGLAGFIISIASLFLCGFPAIIGIIVSALGLRKNPKGFAVAGVLIGLLALLEMIAFCFFLYSAYKVADNIGKTVQSGITEVVLNTEAIEIGQKWEEDGELPSDVDGQIMVNGKKDAFGHQVVYETDGSSFSLRSRGLDGELETDDDIVVGPFTSAEEAATIRADEFEFEGEFGGEFGDEMEKMREKMDKDMEELKKKLDKNTE